MRASDSVDSRAENLKKQPIHLEQMTSAKNCMAQSSEFAADVCRLLFAQFPRLAADNISEVDLWDFAVELFDNVKTQGYEFLLHQDNMDSRTEKPKKRSIFSRIFSALNCLQLN